MVFGGQGAGVRLINESMHIVTPGEPSTAGRHQKRPAAVARLLLVVFSGMILSPLLPASVLEAGLAMCCRRDGRHLCIAPVTARSALRLPGEISISERCPYSPH